MFNILGSIILSILILVVLCRHMLLKKELRRLRQQLKELPAQSGYGSRLYLNFRDRDLLRLIETMNETVDTYEAQTAKNRQTEEGLKQSITGLSHDLRTPLTAISGYTQLLSVEQDESKKQSYLAILQTAIQRLMEMNNHFYELAKIEMDQQPIQLVKINPYQMMEELFLAHYEQFEDKKLTLTFPKEPPEVWILADKLLYTRIIQNIIQNILRYAAKKVDIQLIVSEKVELIFKNDIKKGAAPDIQKVFDRFYTGNVSRTNTESSGLGLFLSKRMTEKLQGTMFAELDKDIFTIRLIFPRQLKKTQGA